MVTMLCLSVGCRAVLLVLSGCESQPRMWVKEGVSPERNQSDRLDCEREGLTLFASGTASGQHSIPGCMARKGYRDATPEEYRKATEEPPTRPSSQ